MKTFPVDLRKLSNVIKINNDDDNNNSNNDNNDDNNNNDRVNQSEDIGEECIISGRNDMAQK